jgi:hypothetical protein
MYSTLIIEITQRLLCSYSLAYTIQWRQLRWIGRNREAVTA